MATRSNGGNGSRGERERDQPDSSENWRAMADALRRYRENRTAEQQAEAQLKVAKAMRDAGVIDEDFALLSIAMAIETIVEKRIMEKSSPALRLRQSMSLERKNGIGSAMCYTQRHSRNTENPKSPRCLESGAPH